MYLEDQSMSDDHKDMFKTGWIQPPTVPFGGSQFDHKVKQMQDAKELAKKIDRWANDKTEKKESK